jgi:predicted nucleic acid-binding protein
MSYAVDTNVLARNIQDNHPMQAAAVGALKALRLRGAELYVLAQNLYEFWAIATRAPEYNGLGLSIAEAQVELEKIKNLFHALADTPAIYPEWERLVIQHTVIGRNAHDARIAAAMKVHGITHLLTFNGDDFKRFQGITVVAPDEVVNQQPQQSYEQTSPDQ